MAWLYQRPDTERWWIGYRHNGVQVLKSTGTADKAEAEKQLAKLEMMLGAQRTGILTLELFQQISGRNVPMATLKAALDDWLKEAGNSTGSRTIEKYQALAKDLTAHFHATERGPLLADITREHLQQFLSEKLQTVSAATVNMARKCLRVFFHRSQVAGIIRDNPADGIKPFKGSRKEQRVRRPFTATEMSALYGHAPDDFWRYMVLGGFFTGLRMGDLVTMPIGAVDLKNQTINLLSRKTDTPMHIPIAAPLMAVLKKVIGNRKGAKATEPIWPEQAERYEKTGSGWFSQRFYDLLLVKAGLASARPHRSKGKTRSDRRQVNEVSFHCFRHSYVSTLAALGHNQQIVKALAGHASDEINDLYTKVPPNVLRDAVALLPDITKAEVTK